MNPKRIGFLGFEGVAASELTRAADVLAAATLDGGYGNRISCYHVRTIGFTSECFHAESGIAFWPDSTLETVSKLDTIVIPGGDGLRQSLVSERIADWILARANADAPCRRDRWWNLWCSANRVTRWPRSHHALALRKRCSTMFPKPA